MILSENYVIAVLEGNDGFGRVEDSAGERVLLRGATPPTPPEQ